MTIVRSYNQSNGVAIADAPAQIIRVFEGATGTNGTDGVGVPVGGTTDQILAKASDDDFDTGWVDAPTGGPGGDITSDDITDATTVGKAVLTAPSQAAGRTAIGAGTSSFDGAYGSLSGKPTLGTAAAADTGDFDPAGAAAAAQSAAEAYTDTAVAGLVPNTRTVNGHALSANVTVSKSDVSLGNADNTADAAKAVLSATKLTTARAINGVSFDGSADITVADSTKVPTTRTVAGHALSADVTLVKGDVGLGNVDNTADSAKTFTESQVTNLTTDLAAKVPKSLFDANTILAADTDDTPAALTVAASRIVGRADSGGIAALTAAQIKTLLAYVVADISDAAPLASPALTGNPTAPTPSVGDNDTSVATTAFVKAAIDKQPEVLMIAVSDETTAITTGTAKVTFRMPFAMALTAVRASLTTASSSGIPTVDINETGTTILSTKLTIDASELTSTTAATAAVISDTSLADDAEITIDIDVAGSGAKGLKVALIGTRT